MVLLYKVTLLPPPEHHDNTMTSTALTTCTLCFPHSTLRPFSSPSPSLKLHTTQNAAFRPNQKLSPPTTTTHFSFSTSSFDVSPPPIDQDFIDNVEVFGDNISEDWSNETFYNDDEAFHAVENGVAVVDLSHYGRIRVSGEDRIHFLHNQSTANFEALHEGEGCDTVFVTPTARTLDIAQAWVMKNAVTLVSPSTSGTITEMLRKYIFLNDKVEIQDISEKTCLFALLGPKSNQVLEALNVGDLMGLPYGSHKHYVVGGNPVTVAVGNVISEDGYSLLMPPVAARLVWEALLSHGAIPMGSNAWEAFRVFQGRPIPGKELTNEYNVLEAGLWNAISLNKGCYKGQETISRLITYDGIKQRLWGIQLSSPAEPGSPITVDGKKVGKLTSYTAGREGCEHFGLGYIKKQAAAGDTVIVGDNISGTVVEVLYLARQRRPVVVTNSRP